jgi:hypothetical protein
LVKINIIKLNTFSEKILVGKYTGTIRRMFSTWLVENYTGVMGIGYNLEKWSLRHCNGVALLRGIPPSNPIEGASPWGEPASAMS